MLEIIRKLLLVAVILLTLVLFFSLKKADNSPAQQADLNHISERISYYAYDTVLYRKLLDHEIRSTDQTKSRVTVLSKQTVCLAKNIYFESRGEPLLGQIAVARVVVNRMQNNNFPSDACDVIFQRKRANKKTVCQFSWTCTRQRDPDYNSVEYKIAYAIATSVLHYNSWKNNFPENMLFFHSIEVDPNWGYEIHRKIGNHIFYKL